MAPVPSEFSIQTSNASGTLLDLLSRASSSQSHDIKGLTLRIARGYDPSDSVEGVTNATFQFGNHAGAPSVTIRLDSTTSLLEALTLCPSAATEDPTSLEIENAISETAQIMKLPKEDVECIIAWFQHLQAVEDPSPDEVQLRDGIQAQLEKRGFGQFLTTPLAKKSASDLIATILFAPVLLGLVLICLRTSKLVENEIRIWLIWRRLERERERIRRGGRGEADMSGRRRDHSPLPTLDRMSQGLSGPAVPEELELESMPRAPSLSAQLSSTGAVSEEGEEHAVPISRLPPLSHGT